MKMEMAMRRLIDSIDFLMESKDTIKIHNRDGTRNAYGRFLARIARNSPVGLEFKDEDRKLVKDLVDSGFAKTIVDRVHVTQDGLDALA